MDLYTCGETKATEVDTGQGLSLTACGFSDPPPHLCQKALTYLKPFVPCEETEGSH